MKKIFAILFAILLSAQCFSQSFDMPVEIGQGFKFIDYHNPQYYMLTSTVKPSIQVVNEKLTLSTIVMTTFSDGVTDVFAGSGASYKIFEKDEFNLQLGGTALFNGNKQLYGGSLTAGFNGLFHITANVRQEYSQKELWFDAGVGIDLFN